MGQVQDRTNQSSSLPACISVLIVDDVPETRSNIRKLLNDPRIRIVGEAGDGNEALRQFHKLLPNVVIMNINMPVRNGIEVTELMCLLEPDANIIILSIQSDQFYVRRTILAGARDYFAKPPDPYELLKSVIRLGSKPGEDSSST